jgi:hypothetical protein
MTKRKIFDELIEGVDAMKKHREGKLTLRSYKEEVEDAVFAGGVCAQAADQRKDAGKMGAGAGQAESAGGSAGSAGAPVSRHAGATGKGGGWLIRWRPQAVANRGGWIELSLEKFAGR